jgi:DNA invertase Pin-like site-specific DNA recombinase
MRGRISATNLERRAYVYVRQSSMAQVMEHTESTRRQYELVDRAVGLGWSREAVEVIDEDQGKSGASTRGRSGFERLTEAVVEGRAGAILALEVSRLSRSSDDWRQLLRLCGVADTVVVDEQAIYHPTDPDDKLLLSIKGTMSEAELHWLGLRMQGARRQKARRGELRITAPTGYVWTDKGLELDPDESVVRAIQVLFDRYRVEPSVHSLLRWARRQGLEMPTRRNYSDGTTSLEYKPVAASRLYFMLHDPTYAGAYAYGRCQESEQIVNGRIQRVKRRESDPDKWMVLQHDAHAGYVSWDEYLRNQEKMRQNQSRMGNSHLSAPREGPALLNGLLVCGRCGHRMSVNYNGRNSDYYVYICKGLVDKDQTNCWSVPGKAIDAAIEDLFLAAMVPEELELGLAVEREVEKQARELERAWHTRLEQVQYEARRAERRYKAVDPDNRVVARTLEREWEQALRACEEAKLEYDRACRERRAQITDQDRVKIRALSKDLPKVWRADTTTVAERKAMLRIAIEAISIEPVELPRRMTRVRVQWKSGDVSELEVARPHRRYKSRTSPSAAERLRELISSGLHDEDVAASLNAEGIPTGQGKTWDRWAVKWARRKEGILRVAPDKPRRLPMPDLHPDGRYSIRAASRRLGVSHYTVRKWIKRGAMRARREDFEQHRGVWWIEVEEIEARLNVQSTRTDKDTSP